MSSVGNNVFLATSRLGVSDEQSETFSEVIMLYSSDLFPSGSDRDDPDVDFIIENLSDKYGGECPSRVIIDIEHWPTGRFDPETGLPLTDEQRLESIRKYIEVINAVRDALPGVEVGIYSMIPPTDYWASLGGGVNSSRYEAWVSACSDLSELAESVDFICPSLYANYNDPVSWIQFSVETINMASMYGKPVYPFVWSRYHDKSTISEIAGESIDPSYFSVMVKICLEVSGNVVFWEKSRDLDQSQMLYLDGILSTVKDAPSMNFSNDDGFVGYVVRQDGAVVVTFSNGCVENQVIIGSDGRFEMSIMVDLSGEMKWERVETYYQDDQYSCRSVYEWDDGTYLEKFWKDGLVVKAISNDVRGVVTTTVFFDNGLPEREVFVDVDGCRPWSEVRILYNESGERVCKEVWVDDGGVQSLYYDGGMVKISEYVSPDGSEEIKFFDENGEVTRVKYVDGANTEWWSSREEDFSKDGFRYVSYNGDDGSREVRCFDGGTLIWRDVFPSKGGAVREFYSDDGSLMRTLQTDEADDFSWREVTSTFVDGERVGVSISWDDGRVSDSLYCNGQLSQQIVTAVNGDVVYRYYDESSDLRSVTFDDVSDSRDWATVSEFYQGGEVSRREVVFDDGSSRCFQLNEDGSTRNVFISENGDTFDRVTSENGLPVSYFVSDVSDEKPWCSIAFSYSENGVMSRKSIVYDDEDEVVFHFSGSGGLDMVEVIDNSDSEEWASVVSEFDGGDLTERRVAYDNGDYRTVTYSDGLMVESVFCDEDGDLVTTTYDNGCRVMLSVEDVQNTRHWSTMNIYYESDGSIYYIDYL